MISRTAFAFLTLLSVSPAGEPRFEAQVIDATIGIGYGLAVGDVDGDGKPDILLADAREIVWYQNPTWKKRQLTGSLTKHDHVCIAARDVDGDGRVEVAVGAQWNPGGTTNDSESGAVFYLQRPANGDDGPWTPLALPHEPTAFGFAEQAGLTGGLGREPYVVTSTADSGPGTYRDALSHGSRYISFAPALAGATIRLASAVSVDGSHLTIDGSTSRVTISGFATKFSGTDIVIAGVTFAQMTGSSDEDAVTFRNASTDQVFALYGNTFKTATDGLVDIIWNGGNDVYATICGNRFEAHDKAMLIHSGDATREGGQYHVTLCRNLWTDVYQRAPYTRDAFVHQYNDVFVDYGKPDGSGGGAKSGASSFRSQHLVENSIARPRAVGTTTWTGELVTKPRTEFAGPHMGDDGNIRVIGSLLLANGGPQATQKESNPVAVFAPSYSYPVRPADSALFQAVVTGAGTCPAVAESRVNPCGGLAGSA